MDKKSFDVTTLGELLIDFTENGSSSQGNPLLEANPGGAVCNVLAMLEKLGKKTAGRVSSACCLIIFIYSTYILVYI